MMRRLLVVAMVLLGAALPALAAAQTREPPVVVAAGMTHDGNLATVDQDILVEGVVTGDVTSMSGTITVNGRVEGDVVSYTGAVIIGPGGQVGGHVLSISGAVRQSGGARVAGRAIRMTDTRETMSSVAGLIVPPSGHTAGNGALLRMLAALALGGLAAAGTILIVALWPNRSAAAAETLRRMPGRATLAGLLASLIVAFVAPVLLGILAASLIGLPLAGLVMLALHLPYLCGLAVLGRALGRRGSLAFDVQRREYSAAALLALVAAALALLSPLAGLTLFYLLALPGLGAMILSRGGLLVPQPA
jgi:cytoskeletal protein CcmA (bactofilin family)